MAYAGAVALITGGGSGMGQLAAQRFAASGARIALLDVNTAGMALTAQGFANISAFTCDISDYAAVQSAVVQIERELGPVDRMFNCAAIMPFGRLLEQDIAQQHRLVQINLLGLINVTQAVLPAMVARGRGDYVSFASTAGIIPGMLMGAYGASKAAVAFYNEVLYHENRNSGVRFVSVCPPVVKTPLLQQAHATVWPKVMDTAPALEPAEVLDAVERCLDNGTFLCTPGKGTRLGHLMRRLFPARLWAHNHKIEGF